MTDDETDPDLKQKRTKTPIPGDKDYVSSGQFQIHINRAVTSIARLNARRTTGMRSGKTVYMLEPETMKYIKSFKSYNAAKEYYTKHLPWTGTADLFSRRVQENTNIIARDEIPYKLMGGFLFAYTGVAHDQLQDQDS